MGPTVIYYMHNVSTTKENYRESLPERQYGQTEARSGDSMSDGRKTRRTILWGKKWTKWTGCEWQRADKGWELHQPRQFISSDNFISIVTVLWNRPPQMRASSLALGWVNPWRECFQRYPRSIFQEDTALSLTQQVLLEHLLSLKVQIQSLTFRSFGLERRLCLEFFF